MVKRKRLSRVKSKSKHDVMLEEMKRGLVT